MEKIIILQGFKPDELFKQIELIVEAKLNEISKHLKTPESTKLLTRKEVCGLLKISLPTLHDWTKQGWLISYKIGSRVLYKTKEIEETLASKSVRKFQR